MRKDKSSISTDKMSRLSQEPLGYFLDISRWNCKKKKKIYAEAYPCFLSSYRIFQAIKDLKKNQVESPDGPFVLSPCSYLSLEDP